MKGAYIYDENSPLVGDRHRFRNEIEKEKKKVTIFKFAFSSTERNCTDVQKVFSQ